MYLTTPLDMCSPPVPHIPDYYREEYHRSGPKMLGRDFKLRISLIYIS